MASRTSRPSTAALGVAPYSEKQSRFVGDKDATLQQVFEDVPGGSKTSLYEGPMEQLLEELKVPLPECRRLCLFLCAMPWACLIIVWLGNCVARGSVINALPMVHGSSGVSA